GPRDWSSDVCSSDLAGAVGVAGGLRVEVALAEHRTAACFDDGGVGRPLGARPRCGDEGRVGNGQERDEGKAEQGPCSEETLQGQDRKSVVEGKGVER